MAELTGRCACGAVTWQSAGPVLWAGHCHCDSCRRATLHWKGDMGASITSNGKVTRQFCAKCGAQMSYQFTGWPDESHLYAATLDDPTRFDPKAHFHYAEKLPWVTVDDNLPKYPGSAETTEPLS